MDNHQHSNQEKAGSTQSNLNINQLDNANKSDGRSCPFQCPNCSYRTSLTVPLKMNFKRHPDTKNFECDPCSFQSKDKRSVQKHYNRTHFAEPYKPFKCQEPNCNSTFSEMKDLRLHQRIHKKDDESVYKYKCSQCPFKSWKRRNLSCHLRTHSEKKPFFCDLCHFKTKHLSSLKEHRKNMHLHPKLKPFKCPNSNCNYSCKTSQDLKRHMQMHETVKSLVCSFANCTFKTKWKSALQAHEIIHRNEKPYKCNFCSSSFSQKVTLTGHMRRHTGEAPYPCDRCDYRAKRLFNLVKHVERHHPQEESKTKAEVSSSNQSGNGDQFSANCKVSGCNFAAGKESMLARHMNESHSLPRVVITI